MTRQFPVDLPEGYVEFYKQLENWQNEQEIRLKQSYSPEAVYDIQLIAGSNKCLMKQHHFMIDPQQYKNHYLALLELLKIYRPGITEILNDLIKAADNLDFADLPGKLLDDDQNYFSALASRLDVPPELLIFIVDHALRPFLRLLAQPYYQAFTHDDFRHWNQTTICPFCGSKSHFSRLRLDDGRRFMFCDRCFTEWESPNLYCVHCGNDEPNTINYLSIENDPSYQLYTCEKCKGYLKTYDERESGKTTDLFIANIETIYLDILAQQKGYVTHDYE